MKDLQKPEPPLAEPVLPKDSSGREGQDDQEEEGQDDQEEDDKGDEEDGKKDDKNDAEKNNTSAGFTFSMELVYDNDAKTNDKKDDKKDGEQDDKKDNDDKKEPEPRATEDTAPQDQEQIGKILRVDAKTTRHLLGQAAVWHKESCILKIFHMSLRSHNCLKQFL